MIKLNNRVSKEDFKRYYASCPKEAYALKDVNAFKSVIDLKHKQNKIETFFKRESMEEDDEFGFSPAPIDPFNDYIEYLENGDSDKINILLESFEQDSGFTGLNFVPEQIIDGNLFGENVRNAITRMNIQSNLDNGTHFKSLDLEGYDFKTSVHKTMEALKDPQNKFIFEAAFSVGNDKLKIRCDVLEIDFENKELIIYEAKATSKIKKEHIYDVIYQYIVLQNWIIENNSEFKIADVQMILTNKEYQRSAVPFDEDLAKSLKDVIDVVDGVYIKYNEIKDIIDNIDNIVLEKEELDLEPEKSISIVKYHTFKKYLDNNDEPDTIMTWINRFIDEMGLQACVYEVDEYFSREDVEKIMLTSDCCSFSFDTRKRIIKSDHTTCYHVVPWFDKKEYNLFEMNGLRNQAVAPICWKQSSKVIIKNIDDIEDPIFLKTNSKGELVHIFNEFTFNTIEIIQKYANNECDRDDAYFVKEDKNYFVNVLQDYYRYPVYMYDFETSKWSVPVFSKQRAYMQTPFQYSIDVLLDDKYEWDNPDSFAHYDYLETERVDPRFGFVKQFIKDSFAHGPGVYVAYNKGFEKGVIKNLAMLFPELRKPLLYIGQNTIDLMDFFRSKGIPVGIYHPEFRGSFSIKKTQPTIMPELNYHSLKINKGDKASYMFRQYIDGTLESDDSNFGSLWKNIYYQDMLDYCNRDTLAMVILLQGIIKILEKHDSDIIKLALENKRGY